MSTPTPTPTPVAIVLTGSKLPCEACGLAVDGPHLKRDVTEHQIVAVTDALGVRDLPQPRVLATTRCDSCRERRERADAVASAHPNLTAWLGSRSIVVDRLEAVLVTEALAGGGLRLEADRDVIRALELVGTPGAVALWVRRLVPVLEAKVRTDSANATPFAHVDAELRQSARDAMAALLRSRMAPAEVVEPLGPPIDSDRRGCLLCGRDRADSWEALTVSTRALGGRPTPEPIEGDVCTACADAVEAVGSVGRTAMTRAVLEHLGVRRTFATEQVLLHLVGWGALPAGTRPNRAPWAHVNTEALRADLRAVAGVS